MKERYEYIEYLSILAIAAVILDHVAIVATSVFKNSITVNDSILYYAIINSSHFAVPVFIMVTGYLLLNPEKDISINKIIQKYVFRMIIVLFTFGVFFAWLEIIFDTKTFNIFQVFTSIYNVIIGNTWDHMWYLYMLIGLYLITPILRKFVYNSTNKEIKYFLLLNLIFLSIFSQIKSFFDIDIDFYIPISSIYPFYYVLGYYIGNTPRTKSNRKIVATSIIICFVILILSAIKNVSDLADYHSFIVIILSASIFILVRDTSEYYKKHYGSFLKLISRCSFGMYVIHMFFINILYKFLKINPFSYNSVVLLVLFIIVFVASLISSYILTKIPIVNKYI